MAPPHPLLAMPGMPVLRDRVESRLLAAVEAGNATMTEMASHLITAGGKRIRPLLTVAAAAAADDVAGGETADMRGGGEAGAAVLDDAVTGGVAVELVHLGSLCHDDVIDEATTRRTVESLNARWGNLRAILAGDFLLARASELAATLGTEVAGELAGTIARLCEGEMHELQHAYRVGRSEAEYLAAIEGKTASLFSTACRIGGLVAGLPPHRTDALARYGLLYGMAFQMLDDVLDVVATDEELGKPAGHDIAEGVYNLPVLRALAGPDGDELRRLLGGPVDAEAQARALVLVRAGTGVAESVGAARGYVERAVEALDPLPPSPATAALAGAARNLMAGVEAGGEPAPFDLPPPARG